MAAVETLAETPAPGAPADTQEAARRDGAETPEVSPNTTLALLQAEMDSVVKSMSDLVKVKDEDQITPYVKDPDSSGEVDVAKEQLDVLVKIQHDLKRQQVVQQATPTSQFLLGKMRETMSKLLTERSNDFERQRKAMMLYMERESNLHQNSMDQIENVVEKVGTTLDQFTSSLTTLSATIKDLSADQRSQGREHLDVLGRIHYEIQGTKGLTEHVRSNTLSTAKEVKALGWQVGELRSGSTDSQGTVSSNKGSLLYLISEDLKTSTESVMNAMATSVKALKETVEAGVNPEKIVKKEVPRVPGTATCGRPEKRRSKTSKGTRRPRTPTAGDYDPSLHRSTDAADGRAKGTVHSWSGYYEAHGFYEQCSSRNRIYECGYS